MSRHTNVSLAGILFSLLAAALPAQTGFITTIAGTGVAGTAGIGGPAVNAQLTGPSGISVDRSNNVYIADALSNRVVRIDGSTGILTLVAGTGAAASTGDNGPAVQASLNNPRGLAVDATGNLFVVEFQGNRVRRIDAATGIITTVAGTGAAGFSGDGGPAVNAAIGYAFSIAMDTSGNLYIADSGNARVRRVDSMTGIINTVAGNGSSTPAPDGTVALNGGLGAPIAVSVDGSQTLVIAEYTNARIRLVDPNTGILSTVAGNGSTTFTGDGVPASDAGIGKVAFNVAADGRGNIYFPDGTGRIRRVDGATRTIVTVAGNGSGAQGLTSSGAGGSGAPSCISTLPGDNGPATSATLDGPFAVAYANGYLLLTDALDCRVRIVSLPSPYPYTNTALTASSVNINQGDPVTFTATVSSIPAGGAPTGYVQFIDQPQGFGPTVLGTAILSGGSASLIVTTLSQNSAHLIGAYYMGDRQFNGSGSPGVAVTVGAPVSKPSPIIGMSAPVYATLNAPTSISVTVSTPYGSTAQPRGSVVLYDGSTPVQTASLVNGAAQFTVTFTAPGDHFMTAAYQGDSNYSQVRTQSDITAKNASSVAIASTPNPSTQGTAIAFTATMTPSTATGYVELHYDSNMLCIATITNGIATCPVSWLPAGNHSIQAFYNGDSALMGSNSTILTQTVKATTTTTVISSAAPSTYGQAVTFTATVSPTTATGTIQFMDGATSLGSASLSAGSAAITVSTLTTGTHSITAIYTGDATNAASTSAVFSQTVQQASVTTTLTSSSNPSTAGQTVTFTAMLSPAAATGSVQFLDGAIVLGTITISGGSAALNTPALSAGSHTITASYSGDANYNGASATVSQAVKAVSALTLSANSTTATFGQAVQLTASISPATATGTVQFLDGTAVLGASSISGGTAALSVSALTVGSHTLTAAYSGDGSNAGSTSATLALIISKASATTTLAAAPNPSIFGQAVTFAAAISPSSATGSVQFLDGSTVLGTSAVSNGFASLALATLTAGTHSITAVYSGDANYAGATSGAVPESVNKAGSAIGLVSTINPSTYGQAVVLTATVSPSSATGSVQFFDGSTGIGTAMLNGGTASFAVPALAAGAHFITAIYSGDANYTGATSSGVAQTVNKMGTSVGLASSANPGTSGQPVTFTATVSPASATGSVQVLDGGTVIGTAAVSGGLASISTSSLAVGIQAISALYSGDGNYSPSTSAALTEVVKVATSTALTSNASTSTYGHSVQFTATVSPSSATGTVQFLDGGALIGTGTVSAGKTTFTTSTLPGGRHSITAVYSGDSKYLASISAALTQTVNKATSTASVSSSLNLNQSLVGQAVTFTGKVSPASVTGSLQFLDGSTVLATVDLSGALASFTTSGLAAGSHKITVFYSGDGNYNSDYSPVLTQNVNKANTSTTLTSSQNPSSSGQSVAFTATVSSATATGTVHFLDGSNSLGTVSLSGGTATFAMATPSSGNHNIKAVYSGDSDFNGSTSATLKQTVN